MSTKPPPKLPTSDTSPLAHNPLAKLAALRTAPPPKEPAAAPAAPAHHQPKQPPAAAKPLPKPAPKLAPGETPPLAHKALAHLQGLRVEPEAAKPAAPTGPVTVRSASPSPVTNPEGKGPAWAVIRLERKGRGGKEATIVEKLALKPAELEDWCKELKASLGCGGAVEGDTIVLQGDLRQRLAALLTKRGVRKVTLG